MAGKYEQFRKQYPKAPIEATAFDKINTVLDAPVGDGALRLRDLDNTELCEFYVHVRKQLDDLEAQQSVLEVQKAALTYLFTERFADDDVTSVKFANGVTLSESIEPYPNVKDRAELIAWIKQTGQDDLLTLNYQTLSSITKQALIEGRPIPPGVELFMKSKLSARGMKNAGEENKN